MTIESDELEELKKIYFKHYGVILSDDETIALGTRLVNLFKILVKSNPLVDMLATEGQNKYEHVK